MKKIILLTFALLLSVESAEAHGGHGWGYGGGWVAPIIIGGAIGYAASRPTVIYNPPPTVVYTAPQTVVVQDNTPTTAVQQTTVVPTNVPVYEERWIYFENCNCKKKVLVKIQ